MIELRDFLGVAGAPLVIALVAATQRVFPDLEARWAPALAFAWAGLLNGLLAYALPVTWPVAVLAWFLCALMASGLYSQTKAMIS